MTGKVLHADNIVRGYEYAKGRYVTLSDEDFRLANPKATQAVEIVTFVNAGSVAPQFFETPYRLVPGKRGEKGYALLREVLKKSGKIGIAQVVIRTKQHLAAVLPLDKLLLLETLRYHDEILTANELSLPTLKSANVSEKELSLATRLIDDMTEAWKPAVYRDTFRDDLMRRIEQKVKRVKGQVVAQQDDEASPAEGGAQVIDLMAALTRSLAGKKGKAAAASGAVTRDKSIASKKPPARKRA